MELGLYQSARLSAVGFATANDKITIEGNRPFDVIRAGFIVSVVSPTDAIAAVLHRTSPGTVAGQITLGTITMVTASRAVGSMLFVDLVSVSPYTGLSSTRVLPGEQIAIAFTTAPASGSGTFFIDVQPRGLHKKDTSQGNYTRLFDSAPTVGV